MNQVSNLSDIEFFWQAPSEALFPQKTLTHVIQKSEAWFEALRCKGGGIPYLKIGHNCLYRKSDVLNWLKKHQTISSTSQYEVTNND